MYLALTSYECRVVSPSKRIELYPTRNILTHSTESNINMFKGCGIKREKKIHASTFKMKHGVGTAPRTMRKEYIFSSERIEYKILIA
jgi:hypothetical protein